jgi:hypothetical protein
LDLGRLFFLVALLDAIADVGEGRIHMSHFSNLSCPSLKMPGATFSLFYLRRVSHPSLVFYVVEPVLDHSVLARKSQLSGILTDTEKHLSPV